jgi:hypothetical protein
VSSSSLYVCLSALGDTFDHGAAIESAAFNVLANGIHVHS